MNNDWGRFRRCALAVAVGLASATQVYAESGEPALEEMYITGMRAERSSKGATGLDMSLFETPQSVSSVDAAFIDSFSLDDANQVLRAITGVNVDEVETDRTYYNARGFEIKSMQVDGTGLPFTWNVVGDIDTAVYEKIEAIRGANGLLTGTGNPSGTINYVRKRPTNDFQGNVSVAAGSSSYKRATADVSVPLTDSGSWAARGVVAHMDTGSYLDNYERQRTVVYGVVDGQVGSTTAITAGYTWQKARSEGVLWGALPMLDSNNQQTDYPTSTSTTMDWTNWETDNSNLFVELAQELGDWHWKTSVNYNNYEEPSELFYTYGTPDAETGLGLVGYPGKYFSSNEQWMVDSTLAGDFDAFGSNHDLLFGVNVSTAANGYLSYAAPADSPAWGALPPLPWRGNEIARPAWEEGVEESDFTTDVQRLYAVANWHLGDFDVITGINHVKAESEGVSFGDPMDWSEQDTSPYLGVTWKMAAGVNLYASYSDIFEPQEELDAQSNNVGPAEGNSVELGAKFELASGRLIASVAVFKEQQDNYAEEQAFDADLGRSPYKGIDVSSEGFELEAQGQLTDSIHVLAGYTQMSLEDENDDKVRTYIPRRTLNLGVTYQPGWLSGLQVGSLLTWQSDIYIGSEPAKISQDSYAIWSAYASYGFAENWELSVNLDNITDEKYLTSLYWDQSYYGEDRSAQAKISYRF
ncbi:TonB-dependent siderophore receptor [Teredinibacter turnerae]|uniref:TonB-dependent siderophore receptor n=1 Tax=Teredinibacter turnerae TaxID=2426 RepID=UPI0030CD416C